MACMSKHVWNLCRKKEAWEKWIQTTRLKNQSFWAIKERSIDSWSWRKILALKDSLRNHVKYRIGDGKSVNCLHDNWSSSGVMVDILSNRDVSNLNMLVIDTVADFIKKTKWPDGKRLIEKVQICKRSMPVELTDMADRLECLGMKSIIQQECGITSDIVLSRVFHHMAAFPREILPTKEGLHKWGIVENNECCFCQEEENHGHLFFQCQHAAGVWRKLLMYLGEYQARWIAGK
ncbi:hypothetical protein LIER_32478 [Lithospermum erythrorhizon]|uniref:Reverse transcriptase zinc-binding domain-containing protein n=1 Tax=Lithospermum erythrorhizon TaxID=34254 RepID=A0AAV3RX30_LITER